MKDDVLDISENVESMTTITEFDFVSGEKHYFGNDVNLEIIQDQQSNPDGEKEFNGDNEALEIKSEIKDIESFPGLECNPLKPQRTTVPLSSRKSEYHL